MHAESTHVCIAWAGTDAGRYCCCCRCSGGQGTQEPGGCQLQQLFVGNCLLQLGALQQAEKVAAREIDYF